jgi:hypothetical protein
MSPTECATHASCTVVAGDENRRPIAMCNFLRPIHRQDPGANLPAGRQERRGTLERSAGVFRTVVLDDPRSPHAIVMSAVAQGSHNIYVMRGDHLTIYKGLALEILTYDIASKFIDIK